MKSFSFLLWSAKIAFVDDEKCNLPNFSFFHEAKGLLSEGFTSAVNHYIYLPSDCRKMGGNLSQGPACFSKYGPMTMSRFTYFDLDSNFTVISTPVLIVVTVVYLSCQKKQKIQFSKSFKPGLQT